MNQVDIIARKRDGYELSEEEIDFLISGYVDGTIPDYQISAFLMAVFFQGMTPQETAVLTRFMRDSGVVLEHSNINGFKIDKHSTGGVGDKVSLILAPLVASAGLYVPMISGRALTHTGGTLDKLESIPGFRTDLSLAEMRKMLTETGVSLVGQTGDLTPADKKIYALRDATATVNSIPLITASILSKKMAEGIDALVLDVKAGNGAIFPEKEKAWELANMLVRTAGHFGLKTSAIITSMEQPLGYAIGNWLETKEAIATLHGQGPEDLTDLALVLSAQMLVLGGKARSIADGMRLLEQRIASGEAFEKFLEIVDWQGGDRSVVENPETYPAAKYSFELKSPDSGYVQKIVSREIGVVSMNLGAGRHSVEDKIAYTSGIVLNKKIGDGVEKGEILATAYSEDQTLLDINKKRLAEAFVVSEQPVPRSQLIYSMIDSYGEKPWHPATKSFE